MKADKIKALISFFGETVESARRRTQNVFHEGIPLCPSMGVPCRLLRTHGYMHFGTRMVPAAARMHELKAKMASTRQAARPLVGKVLRRTAVSMSELWSRCRSCSSRGCSKLRFGPNSKPRGYAVVHAQAMSILRHVLAQTSLKDGVFVKNNGNQVVRRLGAMAPACMFIGSEFVVCSFNAFCIRAPIS